MFALFFIVRLKIEEYRQEITIAKKSKQEGSNQYAINYYQMQAKMLKFRKILLKVINRAIKFWS